MLTDYNLPVFRIVEATVTSYSDTHNGTYPAGTSVDDLAQLDSNMSQLKSHDLLKGTTYSSTGSDRSGFSLQTKLNDGTVLTEKVGNGSQAV